MLSILTYPSYLVAVSTRNTLLNVFAADDFDTFSKLMMELEILLMEFEKPKLGQHKVRESFLCVVL